ncbi:putative inorganic phosphate cotransporter [Nasonia vitripennis]|uniref:Sialin n=1 Tax=Nasonia vitripennis TaxID=7425 RepID=A0A7M7QNQ6_NASVI|nr:putative inorganic phosphate cotransporter [Nasonia vitripennis]XP_031778516.1 putative inorganic phosphate cotransporter [Nasonia vitripennis]XP_031778517.1 putative inorganic phosphate cotransporter [Nasonia vitripennis]XP_031778518.1 putative inorganic phosphate cotransporter [Nasonia vitripennis]XP_032452509.1 putative inorganic phosphate cotransporter [Nasonia vitripennis]
MLTSLKHCCAPIPQRWIFAFMSFLALVMAYGMRVSISITITEMVKHIEKNVTIDEETCPKDESSAPKNTTGTGAGTYDWDEETQGIILSSFYWGYVITQLPGALLAEKFGGKQTLGLGMLCTAILTIAIPFAVTWGESTALIVLRVLMGLGEGVTLPALNVMLAQWVPPDERSKTGSFVYVGAPLGTVFATAISGVILKYTSWPIVFYFFGGIGIVWYFIWLVTCYNTPREHPFISDKEATFLHQELSAVAHVNPPPVPWRHLLKSMPLWALISVQIGHDWGFYTISTELPKYMSSVLHYSVDQNGYLSSLPYIGMWLCCTFMSWLADWLISKGHMAITTVRKVGTTIASVGPGLFVIAASYVGCDRTLVVVMFTLGVTLLGSGIPSLKVNALDLSPNYAGTVMAISNGAAACTGIITPYLTGVLTPDQTLSQWRVVFWIIFVVLMVSNVFYLIFASGKVADWNDPILMKRNKAEQKRAQEAAAFEASRKATEVY